MQNRSWSQKIIKFLASLQLAVVIIIALAILTAIGTFVEAQYRAEIAKKLVYDSIWMQITLGSLAVCLTAVMVDRWPWKKRHTPFVLAHIGILILLLGSLITQKFGVDGSMRIGIGDSNQFVVIPPTDFQVWSSFDGERFSKLIDQEIDFYLDPPNKNSYEWPLVEGALKVTDYMPFAIAAKRVQAAQSARAGAAVRFQLSNAVVNVTEWVVQRNENDVARHALGPAEVLIGPALPEDPKANIIHLNPQSEKEVRYTIYYADANKKKRTGKINIGDVLQTDWMGLEFRLISYIPKAEEVWEFRKFDYPTDLTNAAIEVEFNGNRRWVQQNDVVKFFSEQAVYIVTFGNRRIDIGFPIKMLRFEVGRYQGTMRAASYQSLVEAPEVGEHLISMNEPLKHGGFTFYQASFQEGPTGEPIASILSVNYDPGRWLKYLGSLVLSLGVVWLFYQKRRSARAQAPQTGNIT